MPSRLHEVLIEMFRDRPALAADLLSGPLKMSLPEFQRARLSPGELTDVVPTEYRADAVVTLNAREEPVLAIVVEVQLRFDSRKRRSWPAYVGTLYARLGCRVVLLVLCPDQSVADRCATPIVFGEPGLVLTPVVLGPAQVPVVTDLDLARRNPQLAILSVMAHADREHPDPLFHAYFTAFDVIDSEHAALYHDLVVMVLSQAARIRLEEYMSTTAHRYQSEFALRYFNQGEAKGRAEGEAHGRAEGEARAVLAVLDARGVKVPPDAQQTIMACADLDQLDIWVRRAVTAETVDDLF